MKIKKEYERWLANAVADTDVAVELKAMDYVEVEDAFYRDLAFGTGGLRGVIGAGTNRMNIYTVAKASQGLADYLKKHFKEPSVAIGYDSKWCQCQYLACPDAGTDRIFCDSLSAYFCRCHGDSFPQSRQIQWLQGLWC
jgi:hypothetical protein